MFFGYNGINKNAINIVFAILIIYSFLGMGTDRLIYLAITLPAVIIAITFHEFAHALAADKLGDTTPRNQGRLSLNPLVHLDLFGFFLMMFANIGWGKPVQINPNNFNSNKSRNFCESMVALAGPLMNFFIAIIATFVYVIFKTVKFSFLNSTIGIFILYFFEILITVNIGLGVFNLIPLPPLDGEKIFRNVLPYKAKQWLDTNYQTLYWVFMLLWIFGLLEVIVTPVVRVLGNALVLGESKIVGIFI